MFGCALSFLDHKANLSPYLFQCGLRKYFITRPHLCVTLLIPSNNTTQNSYLGLHRTNTARKRWKSDPTKLLTPNKFEEWLISATGKFLKCLKWDDSPCATARPTLPSPTSPCHRLWRHGDIMYFKSVHISNKFAVNSRPLNSLSLHGVLKCFQPRSGITVRVRYISEYERVRRRLIAPSFRLRLYCYNDLPLLFNFVNFY